MKISGNEILEAASKRVEKFVTMMGLATIVLGMAVSFVFLIISGDVSESRDIVSQLESDDTVTLKLSLDHKSDTGAGTVSAALVNGQAVSNYSVEDAITEVSIFDRVFSGEELCIAQAVYFEARGEPLDGQIAVAEVVRNRVAHSRYPSDACRVVFQNERRRHKCQFSFACDGKPDRPRDVVAWETALKVVALVSSGQMTTIASNATHYHASYVKPRWRTSFNKLGQIGRHIFYSDGSA